MTEFKESMNDDSHTIDSSNDSSDNNDNDNIAVRRNIPRYKQSYKSEIEWMADKTHAGLRLNMCGGCLFFI